MLILLTRRSISIGENMKDKNSLFLKTLVFSTILLLSMLTIPAIADNGELQTLKVNYSFGQPSISSIEI
jgi:hypothetical protein